MLKTNTVKRISAFFLALMMILGTLPLNVFAEGLQGKTASPIVIDSNTINEEDPSDEGDSTTGSKTHTISFNPNGGSGKMKPVEVADGKNYTLPKNEFKAPEGKKFKSWTFENEEQEEGYILTVTRDLELKANWEDAKTNPIKKAINSILGTSAQPNGNNNLEISEEMKNDPVSSEEKAVSADGTTGIGKVDIEWQDFPENTIVSDVNKWEDFYTAKKQTALISYSLFGKKEHKAGNLKISVPKTLELEGHKGAGFDLIDIPVPSAKLNSDGTINLDYDYGNATFAYKEDKKNNVVEFVNIKDIPAGHSGALSLNYNRLVGAVADIKKEIPKGELEASVNLKYNDEEINKKSNKIYVQLKRDIKIKEPWIFGKTYGEWQKNWPSELKPTDGKKYIYAEVHVKDDIMKKYISEYDVELSLSPVGMALISYTSGREWKGKPEIIATSDIQTEKPWEETSPKYSKYNGDPVVKKSYSVRSTNDEKYKHDNSFYALLKYPLENSGFDKNKNHINFVVEGSYKLTSPIGNKSLKSKAVQREFDYREARDREKLKVRDNHLSTTSAFAIRTKYGDAYLESSRYENKDIINSYETPFEVEPSVDAKKDGFDIKTMTGFAPYMYKATYDGVGAEDDIASYGAKVLKHEFISGYSYLKDNDKKELTNEDYFIKSTAFGINGSGETNKDPYNVILFGKKSSGGNWEKLAEMAYNHNEREESITSFSPSKEGVVLGGYDNYKPSEHGKDILLPEGYTQVKYELKTKSPDLSFQMYTKGHLKPTDRLKEYIGKSNEKEYNLSGVFKLDPNYNVYDENDKLVEFEDTLYDNFDPSERTKELNLSNYGNPGINNPLYVKFVQKERGKLDRNQEMSFEMKTTGIGSDVSDKYFSLNSRVKFTESVDNIWDYKGSKMNEIFHEQESGTFHVLLPRGIVGVKNVRISSEESALCYKDKSTGSPVLNSNYKLIPNWRGTSRTMLVASFDNAVLKKNKDYPYDIFAQNGRRLDVGLNLKFESIYPWDMYKEVGKELESGIAAYESGGAVLKDDGTKSYDLEQGFKDDPTEFSNHDGKIFNEKEANLLKGLNPKNTNAAFVYGKSEKVTIDRTYESSVGLTKQVTSNLKPNYSIRSSATEGTNYSYQLRMQAEKGTSASNLILFDSIENYKPSKSDEIQNKGRWKGTLKSIDLLDVKGKGINPKVYVSTIDNLDIEKNNDLSNASVWKLYKEGEDLSNVKAIAFDLSKKTDGSDFVLRENTAVNIGLNLEAPWNLTKNKIKEGDVALNNVFAKQSLNTLSTNKSKSELISGAYTSIEIKSYKKEIKPGIKKILKYFAEGQVSEWEEQGGMFKFEILDSNKKVIDTISTAQLKDYKLSFGLDDVGEHKFYVREIPESKDFKEAGMEDNVYFDKSVKEFVIDVKEVNDGSGKHITFGKNSKIDGLTFKNIFVDKTFSGKINAKVKFVNSEGKTLNDVKDKLEYVLRDSENKEVARVKNDSDGNIVFDTKEFYAKDIGEHQYTIEQIAGKGSRFKYDNNKEVVKVKVEEDDKAGLKVTVTYDKDGAVFTNKLNTTSIQFVRLAEGEKPFVAEEVKNDKGLVVSHKISDKDKAKTLDGAEYDIYKINSDGTETKVTSTKTENGISNLVENLVPGKYKLKETKAPKGHFASKEDVVFEIEEKDAGNAIVKFVSNTEDGTKITNMPSTGGQGTKALMIGGGALLIAMAGVFALANKKKKELNK